jgi:hypothetical protein
MKATTWQGLAVATVALALLSSCSGGDTGTPRSAPAPSAASPTQPAEPPYAGSTPPASRTPSPSAPREPVPREPRIGRVWMTPGLRCQTVCTLPVPAGTVTFHAQVSDATRVEFFLVPTGTETWSSRESIGVDRSGEDGWSVRYTYADEPLWSHVIVTASGPGGETEKLPFNLYHPDPR